MDTQVFPSRQQNDNGEMKLPEISSQTYISVSLFAMILAGFWAVLNTLYGAKSEINSRIDKVEWNQSQMRSEFNEFKNQKSATETWTDRDMFKWSVHLQRDNPNIKVPEPELRPANP